MRIPAHHNRDDFREQAAMTPMIDVVFLLLIFFVCASIGQIRELILPTELAAGGIESTKPWEQSESPRETYWLYVRRSGGGRTTVEINGAEFNDFGTLSATLRGLAELAADDPLILDIAPAVPMEDMIRVFDTCRAAGFQSIHFAVEKSDTVGAGGKKVRE